MAIYCASGRSSLCAATPTLTGTGDPDGVVQLTVQGDGLSSGSVQFEVPVDATGHWTYVWTSLADGFYSVTASATDAAGNVSNAALVFWLDTVAPDVTIQLDQANSIPVLTGSGDPRATVLIRQNGTLIGTTTANDSGRWSFVPTIGGGGYTFSATETDGAGNTDTASLEVTLPGIGGLTTEPGTGSVTPGQTVRFYLSTVNPVAVSGTPYLTLSNGAVATYDALRSTATTLAFQYTVQAGEDTPDLQVTGVTLNGGTIALTGAHASLSAPSFVPGGPDLLGMVAADLNGDGLPDLVARDSGAVRIVLADGSGGFSAPTAYELQVLPLSITVADVNGDGAADIVAGASDRSVRLGSFAGGGEILR